MSNTMIKVIKNVFVFLIQTIIFIYLIEFGDTVLSPLSEKFLSSQSIV